MLVPKLILKRFIQKLGPHVLWFVVVPILILIVVNRIMIAVAYVECLALNKPAYWVRGSPATLECR